MKTITIYFKDQSIKPHTYENVEVNHIGNTLMLTKKVEDNTNKNSSLLVSLESKMLSWYYPHDSILYVATEFDPTNN